MRKSGIYAIVNLVNKKVYIGSSTNISKRWRQHKNELRIGIHSNNHLQKSWNKYSESKFVFSILEESSKESLIEREIYWIRHYNSISGDLGYNQTIPNTAEYRNPEKQIGNKLKKEIVAIEKVSGEISIYPSIAETARKFGLKDTRVREICKFWKDGIGTYRSSKGMIFVYSSNYNKDFDYIGFKKKK